MFQSTGITRIDNLINESGPAEPIAVGDSDRESVEAIQEFLRCFDLRKVPGRRQWEKHWLKFGEKFGVFGYFTQRAVTYMKEQLKKQNFKLANTNPVVDGPFLRAMITSLKQTPAKTPSACRLYLTTILGFPFTTRHKVMCLITTYEENDTGGFCSQSNRTQTKGTPAEPAEPGKPGKPAKPGDHAGLSYGILQWTHRSTRLHKLLKRFNDAHPIPFKRTFSTSSTTIADMLDHASQIGLDHLNPDGTTNEKFKNYDFFSQPWKDCFAAAGRKVEFQELQVMQGAEDVGDYYRSVRGYATILKSQREVGFWLDLTNQMGAPGAKTRYEHVVEELRKELGHNPEAGEVINRVVKESEFPERRKYFRDAAPLSEHDPFPEPF